MVDLRDLNILNLEPIDFGTHFKVGVLYWDEANQCKQFVKAPPPFRPYLYISKQAYRRDPTMADKMLKAYDPSCWVEYDNAVGYDDEALVKLTASTPALLDKLKSQVGIDNVYGDVPYWRRVMLDLNLEPKIPDKLLYYDLELDPRPGIQEIRAGRSRVLSIGAVDSDENEFFFCEDDERRTIERFLKLTFEYPLQVGWNNENFDDPTLLQRAAAVGLPIEEFWFPAVDGLQMYKQMRPKGVDLYSLDATAQRELGETKIALGEDMRVLYDYFANPAERHKLRAYNMQDCHLVRKIDAKLAMTSLRVELCKLTHYLPARYRGRMSPADNLVLSIAMRREPRLEFGAKPFRSDEARYEGPMVLEPKPGLHKNVAVIDFTNMHPSIIKMLNLGPSTWLADKSGEVLAPRGSFTLGKRSVFVEALERLTELRYRFKAARDKLIPESPEWKVYDMRQKAAKTQLLTVYGILGAPASRYYNPNIAENITLSCKLVQMFVAARAAKLGFEVVYGVVDSIFIKFPENLTVDEVIEKADALIAVLNFELRDYTKQVFKNPQAYVTVDLDRIYSRMLLTDKKQKYAGFVLYEEEKKVDYLHIMGFSPRRGNVPQGVRETEGALLKMCLEERPAGEIRRFISEVRGAVLDGSLDEKLPCYVQLTKDPREYDTKLPHVKVVEHLMEKGVDIRVGDKVGFLVVGTDRQGKAIPIPANGKKLNLTIYQRRFIWDHYFQSMVDRLPLDLSTQQTLGGFCE